MCCKFIWRLATGECQLPTGGYMKLHCGRKTLLLARALCNRADQTRLYAKTTERSKAASFRMEVENSIQEPSIWSSSSSFGRRSKIEIGKQIFCNRSLNMKNIVAVGFDMDYTLAQYKLETFEALSYKGTIAKLVCDLGYPRELLAWSFDWTYMIRGLVLDKRRGNILKMDRHKYVKVAYHGFREISKEEKVASYGTTLIREAFDEPDFALIDTLFSLAGAYLFAQLVEFIDSSPEKFSEGADYAQMYNDVRAAVDLCHKDGTIKKMVARDPKMFINNDGSTIPLLKMFRDSGRLTFLVTNSLWDYTNIVMSFLCESHTEHGSGACDFDWLQYFDVVITDSAKPSFFHEDNCSNILEVELNPGMLQNADNDAPAPQVRNAFSAPLKDPNKHCRVFRGGNVGHLHKLLSIESSSQVLYVGDHIYGDILRSKKALDWRTMLIVPELEKEVELLWELRKTRKQLQSLRNERDQIEDEIYHLKISLKSESINEESKLAVCSAIDELESRRFQVRTSHQLALGEHHRKFHPAWGQLLKTGYQNSRFAHQVERFACLYTSQLSNLCLYPTEKYYRPSEDFMPHEFDIFHL